MVRFNLWKLGHTKKGEWEGDVVFTLGALKNRIVCEKR